MTLPDSIATAVASLFEALPLDSAMNSLVVQTGASKSQIEIVEDILRTPAIAQRPALQAGLWLYVDELDRSHTVSQGISDATGSFWHGIMHRREGDFGNSHYWFNRTGHHPAMDAVEGYAPHVFIDEVAAQYQSGDDALAALQRREWTALFSWCAHAS